MALDLDVKVWAEAQFGNCKLGDARRTKRAVKMAAAFAENPGGSTPEQTEIWSECKAAYNLLDCEQATFSALATPHWEQTKARGSGHYLLLGDTTFVSFDGDRQISGMGIITSGKSKGYLLHSEMLVDADGEMVHGLAGQTIHYRQRKPRGEKQRDRLRRPRESEIWGEVIDQIGAPPQNVRFTHVFDRGADNFEVFCHLLLKRCDWVIRASALTRKFVNPQGEAVALGKHLKSLPAAGAYELAVRAQEGRKARTAVMQVRFGKLTMPRRRDCGLFARKCGLTAIPMQVVEVLEVNPPPGVKPLHWVLLTSHEVGKFAEAQQIVQYYAKRWLIEEFHKALKTGCRLESRLYETAARWEALTAFLSIVAVRLLQMKLVARAEPDRPAAQLVPLKWIEMLSAVRTGKHKKIHTARDFLRALAGLGGHLGRTRDGEPGWITIWRGFNKLHLLLRGAATREKRCG